MTDSSNQDKKPEVIMFDPPSGWKYGFPKAVPSHVISKDDYRKWLKDSGYPEKDIEFALKYSRHWTE